MASGAIERYLLEFNDALVAGAERRERILAEVEDHLRDAAESQVATGSAPDEAEREAVRRFGDPAAAAERFGPDPLGRAQQVARWYDARRAAHPILVPIVGMSPLIALVAWSSGLSLTLLVLAMLVCGQISSNLRARQRPAAPAATSRTSRSRPAPAAIAGVARSALAIAVLVVILTTTTTWFQLLFGYYALCGAGIFWARPPRCLDRACPHCGGRWAARHPSAAAPVRAAAWALALAGPALAQTVPATAGYAGFALFTLMLLMVLAPLPTRRGQQWLSRRRPVSQVALRAAPLVTLLAIEALHDPSRRMFPVIAVVLAVYVAAALEIRRSRWRSDATRHRLVQRIRGIADEGTAQ